MGGKRRTKVTRYVYLKPPAVFYYCAKKGSASVDGVTFDSTTDSIVSSH